MEKTINKLVMKRRKSLADCHYLSQSEYVYDINGCRVCDDILMFEELTDNLKSLFRRYGIDYHDIDFAHLVHPAKCEDLNYEDLPPMTPQIINDRYKYDFMNFGYEMIIPNISKQ